MQVTICGPNLRDQRKGQFHVHAAGCGDLKHYGGDGKHGGEDGGWTVEAETTLDVCAAVYADHLSDYGLTVDDEEGQETLDGWLSDFHFAPCVKGLS